MAVEPDIITAFSRTAGNANVSIRGSRPETRGSLKGSKWCFPTHFGCGIDALDGLEPTGRCKWRPAQTVDAVAYDTPVVGWRREHVNTLRLWSARAPDPRRLDPFNRGDHRSIGGARPRGVRQRRALSER